MLGGIWSSRARWPRAVRNFPGRLGAPRAGSPAAWGPLGAAACLRLLGHLTWTEESGGRRCLARVLMLAFSSFSCYFVIAEVKLFIITEGIIGCLVLNLSSPVLCFRGWFRWGVLFGFTSLLLLCFLFFTIFLVVGWSLLSCMKESPTSYFFFNYFGDYLNYNFYNYHYLQYLKKMEYAFTYSIQVLVA